MGRVYGAFVLLPKSVEVRRTPVVYFILNQEEGEEEEERGGDKRKEARGRGRGRTRERTRAATKDQGPRPKTQDPRPKDQDPRTKTPSSRLEASFIFFTVEMAMQRRVQRLLLLL
jgi:hypothetical protein